MVTVSEGHLTFLLNAQLLFELVEVKCRFLPCFLRKRKQKMMIKLPYLNNNAGRSVARRRSCNYGRRRGDRILYGRNDVQRFISALHIRYTFQVSAQLMAYAFVTALRESPIRQGQSLVLSKGPVLCDTSLHHVHRHKRHHCCHGIHSQGYHRSQ